MSSAQLVYPEFISELALCPHNFYSNRERERERERKRERDRQTDRQIDRQTERKKERERDRQTDRQRQREREREREREQFQLNSNSIQLNLRITNLNEQSHDKRELNSFPRSILPSEPLHTSKINRYSLGEQCIENLQGFNPLPNNPEFKRHWKRSL